MGTMLYRLTPLSEAAFIGYAVAEEEAEYSVSPESKRATESSLALSDKDKQPGNDVADRTTTESPGETVAARIDDGKKLRLAMALVDGVQSTSDDRAANTAFLRNRLALAAGQDIPPKNAEELRSRLKSLARAADRNLAEQLPLLVQFDEEKLYAQEGCRSMLVWMDVHLKLGRVAAFERLRVGRALSELPILSSLFALGLVSFSQLREVTRHATAATDSEFSIAVLELSVSETIEYCKRFRHFSDKAEDAANADAAGQEEADAQAAFRAYQRRSLSVRQIDAHSTRITLELPNDLSAEFLHSLEQVEDWIREGGEDQNVKADAGDPDVAAPTATQRRADAAVLMSRRSLALAGEAVAMADRYRVHVDVGVQQLIYGPEGIHGFEPVNAKETRHPLERPQLRGHGPVSHAVARRIAASAGFTVLATNDGGEVVGTNKRAAAFSKSQLRALNARDRCCQVPGCGATRHLHGHHVVHRENGGLSDLSNAIQVCSSCHRLLHEGGFRLERIGPNGVNLGPYATALGAMHGGDARAQATAKINKIRRYRLYGADGREHGSLAAARETNGSRTLLLPRSSEVFTRRDSPEELARRDSSEELAQRGPSEELKLEDSPEEFTRGNSSEEFTRGDSDPLASTGWQTHRFQ